MYNFIVVYEWDTEINVHGFETLQEAIDDRKLYSSPEKHRIYQLVKEKVTYTLPDGTEATYEI